MSSAAQRQTAPSLQSGDHDISRSMPWSEMAEKGILSSILNDPVPLLTEARSTVPPEAFYAHGNRLLYETLLEMHASRRPTEFIALSQYLTDKHLMDKVGGPGTLAEILDFVGSGTFFNHYRGILLDKWMLRRGIGVATKTIQEAYEFQQGGLEEWTRKFAASALDLRTACVRGSSALDGSDLLSTHDQMIHDMYTEGAQTGFSWLDRIFGGLLETGLVLFQGRRAIGKSSITRQIAWNAAKRLKIPTEIFTVEMTKVQYYNALCCLEGVSSKSFLQKTFTKPELAILDKMKQGNRDTPLKLHEDARTIDEVVARMETAHLRRGSRLFVVDMPQRLSGDKREGRERELSGIFWALKDAAVRLKGTVIAPVHLNAALIARGSEDIENHADQIIIMAANKKKQPTPFEKWTKEILFKATKNRYGPEGACIFHFYGENFRFEEGEENDELNIEPAEESRPKR